MIICNFGISIVKHNTNWLFFFKNSDWRAFLALGFNVKTVLGPREEKLPPWSNLLKAVLAMPWLKPLVAGLVSRDPGLRPCQPIWLVADTVTCI